MWLKYFFLRASQCLPPISPCKIYFSVISRFYYSAIAIYFLYYFTYLLCGYFFISQCLSPQSPCNFYFSVISRFYFTPTGFTLYILYQKYNPALKLKNHRITSIQIGSELYPNKPLKKLPTCPLSFNR